MDDERHLGPAPERLVEPPVETELIHAGEAVDLRLALGRLPQPVAVMLRNRFDPNDLAFERAVWTQTCHRGASIAAASPATNRRAALSGGGVLRCPLRLSSLCPGGYLPSGSALLHVELQLIAVRFDQDLVAGLDLAAQHHAGKLVLDEALDRARQRPCAELRVVPLAGQKLHGVL